MMTKIARQKLGNRNAQETRLQADYSRGMYECAHGIETCGDFDCAGRCVHRCDECMLDDMARRAQREAR